MADCNEVVDVVPEARLPTSFSRLVSEKDLAARDEWLSSDVRLSMSVSDWSNHMHLINTSRRSEVDGVL